MKITIQEKQIELKNLGAEILNLMKDAQGNKSLIEDKQAQGRQIIQEIEEIKKQKQKNTLPAETFRATLEGTKTYEELLETIPEEYREEFEKTIKPKLELKGIPTI